MVERIDKIMIFLWLAFLSTANIISSPFSEFWKTVNS